MQHLTESQHNPARPVFLTDKDTEGLKPGDDAHTLLSKRHLIQPSFNSVLQRGCTHTCVHFSGGMFLSRRHSGFSLVSVNKVYTRTPVFTAALLTHMTWKQPRCQSTGEWIQRLQDVYTVDYYSVIKKQWNWVSAVRWMNLEAIIQVKSGRKRKWDVVYEHLSMESRRHGTEKPIFRGGMELQM